MVPLGLDPEVNPSPLFDSLPLCTRPNCLVLTVDATLLPLRLLLIFVKKLKAVAFCDEQSLLLVSTTGAKTCREIFAVLTETLTYVGCSRFFLALLHLGCTVHHLNLLNRTIHFYCRSIR